MPQKLRITTELFLSFFVGETQIPCTFDLHRMPLSRSYRTDRRRRVMRETIAADSDFAVESARAQKKARRASESDPTELLLGNSDKGYSQGVRKTCQHRLVQLIPVRPGSLATVLTILWCTWGMLLGCHYWFHVRANSIGRSPILLWQLFDLRSPHSIANWLTCQLWMMTALCAWMIFQLRRHKADDYNARYRIWIMLTGVAIYSSFDTSTASLFLLGQSIDPWTRSEIGYGGWPLVLATYASFVGLIGLRLSTELKSTPAALVLLIGGLVSWASAALLGTGLLKLDWSPGTIDLIVGACWLGGVLAVFQAAGLYLRHCYVQAQKRFLERTALAKQSGFAMPKLPWKRSQASDAQGESADSDEDVLGTIPKRSWLPWRNRSSDDDGFEDEDDEDGEDGTDAVRRNAASTTAKASSKKGVAVDAFGEPKKPMRLFGFIPHRSERNEQIDNVADGELLREDDGGPVDVGLTKKTGWFGRKVPASTDAESESPTTKKQSVEKQPAAQKPSSRVSSDSDVDAPDAETFEKRRWLAKFWKSKTSELTSDAGADVATAKPSTSKPIAAKGPASESANGKSKSAVADDEASPPKKSWFPFGRSKSDPSDPSNRDDLAASKKGASEPKPKKVPKEPKAPKEPGQQRVKKLVGRITSWLDGLKLKPPVDESTELNSDGTDVAASRNASSGPKPIDSSRPLPGTQYGSSSSSSSSASDANDDDENSDDYRYMSKAERKRLRRQQNDRGAA